MKLKTFIILVVITACIGFLYGCSGIMGGMELPSGALSETYEEMITLLT